MLYRKTGKICESVVRLDGKETYVIDNGVYRLGMTTWEGWKQMEFVHAEGLHPDSRNSVVIDASDRCEGEKVYITLQLWSKSGSKMMMLGIRLARFALTKVESSLKWY